MNLLPIGICYNAPLHRLIARGFGSVSEKKKKKKKSVLIHGARMLGNQDVVRQGKLGWRRRAITVERLQDAELKIYLHRAHMSFIYDSALFSESLDNTHWWLASPFQAESLLNELTTCPPRS